MPSRAPSSERRNRFTPDLSHEAQGRALGYQAIAGIDEAGRGPLAGPLVVGAAILPEDYSHPTLNDSKKLTPARREALYAELTGDPRIAWAVVVAEAREIDELNVLAANHAAMRRVLAELPRQADYALIDGLPVPAFPLPQLALVKGDSRSLSIAAASILAKVTRDRLMLKHARSWPLYGFERHKGYGTAAHLAALARHGPCPLHRQSFAPVREALRASGPDIQPKTTKP